MATPSSGTAVSATSQNPSSGWGWYLFFGIIIGLIGALALGSVVATTYFTTMLLGWLFLIAGVVWFFSIFFSSENRLSNAFLGILYAIVGLAILFNPGISLATLTLFLAIAWTVSGLVRVIAGLFGATESRAWSIIGGIATFLLGVAVWMGWPEASLYFIGLFVAIDLVLIGVMMSIYALRLRSSF